MGAKPWKSSLQTEGGVRKAGSPGAAEKDRRGRRQRAERASAGGLHEFPGRRGHSTQAGAGGWKSDQGSTGLHSLCTLQGGPSCFSQLLLAGGPWLRTVSQGLDVNIFWGTVLPVTISEVLEGRGECERGNAGEDTG